MEKREDKGDRVWYGPVVTSDPGTEVTHSHRYINSTDLVLLVLVFANYYTYIIYFIHSQNGLCF